MAKPCKWLIIPINIIINSFTEYKSKLKEVISNDEIMYIEKAELLENSIEVDFFSLKHLIGGNFYVSEKLKQEIEVAGCTGIEFQPIELSYNEWVVSGGKREKIYMPGYFRRGGSAVAERT